MEYLLFIATDTEPDTSPRRRSGHLRLGRRGRAPRHPAARRCPPSAGGRDDGPGPGRPGPGHGRPVHGVEGVDRRLRPPRVRGPRPGDRLREPPPDGSPRAHRDPAGAGARRVSPAADAVADAHRSDWARIVAGLIRMTGDWALAEDATSDAFATALVRWEADGTPPNPGAWLALTARNRAIDLLRRAANERAKLAVAALDDDVAARRGRSAAADLHLLPSRAGPPRPGRADVADRRRTRGRGHRPRLPRLGAHDGAAPGAGPAQDRQRRHPLPGPVPRAARAAAGRGARRRLPRLQPGLLGGGRHGVGVDGDRPRTAAGRPHADRVRGAWAARAADLAALPPRRPPRARRRALDDRGAGSPAVAAIRDRTSRPGAPSRPRPGSVRPPGGHRRGPRDGTDRGADAVGPRRGPATTSCSRSRRRRSSS